MLTEGIATSEQPSKDKLFQIAKTGYKIVINLGLSDVEHSVRKGNYWRPKKWVNIHIYDSGH